MKNENGTSYESINELYMKWINEEKPFMQRKRRDKK